MRKFFLILTLAVSYVAATGIAGAVGAAAPQCDPNCQLGGSGDSGAPQGDKI